MAYKLIKEWFSNDKKVHEITVYKYNISHDEMVRYTKENGTLYKIEYLPNEIRRSAVEAD